MRNIKLAIVPILIVSVLVLSSCQKKQPAAEPEDKPESQAEKTTIESVPKPESNPEAEQAAVQAANAWLKIVDSGDYAESWQESAKFFRNALAKDRWEQSCQAFREPLGKLVSRQVKLTRYTTTAPGAPDGQYVIIQYNSSFENKKSAVETVTPMLDKDGQWRVSGYYIK